MSNTRIKEIKKNNNYFINNIDFSIKNDFEKKINVLNNRNKEIDTLDFELAPYVKNNETIFPNINIISCPIKAFTSSDGTVSY